MILFIQMLEKKLAEADKESAFAKIKMKQAETVVIESKAKLSQKVQAKQAVTATNIESINQRHQCAIKRVKRGNKSVNAACSACVKDEICIARKFVAYYGLQIIANLRETVREE